jgi:membrane protein
MSLSMSERAPAEPADKSRPKLPVQALPWIGLVALAALWPRRRKPPPPGLSEPVVMGPAEFEAAEPGRGRAAKFPWLIPPLGWKDIFWRTYREIGRDRLQSI